MKQSGTKLSAKSSFWCKKYIFCLFVPSQKGTWMSIWSSEILLRAHWRSPAKFDFSYQGSTKNSLGTKDNYENYFVVLRKPSMGIWASRCMSSYNKRCPQYAGQKKETYSIYSCKHSTKKNIKARTHENQETTRAYGHPLPTQKLITTSRG